MAMIMTNPRPSPRINSTKPGKARCNEGAVVDLHRLLAGEPENDRRHGDAVIHVRGDDAAAGGHGRCRAR